MRFHLFIYFIPKQSVCVFLPCNKILSNNGRNALKFFFTINIWVCNNGEMILMYFTYEVLIFLLLLNNKAKVLPTQIRKLLSDNKLWILFCFSQMYLFYAIHVITTLFSYPIIDYKWVNNIQTGIKILLNLLLNFPIYCVGKISLYFKTFLYRW